MMFILFVLWITWICFWCLSLILDHSQSLLQIFATFFLFLFHIMYVAPFEMILNSWIFCFVFILCFSLHIFGEFSNGLFSTSLIFFSIMWCLPMSHQRHSSFSGIVVFVLFRVLNFWYFLLIHSTLDMFCSAHRNFSCLSMRLEIWMKWYN